MRQQIIRVIQDLAKTNFNSYREQYVCSLDDAISAIEVLAEGYYENRNEDEIKRDEANKVSKQMYERCISWAFCEWFDKQPEARFKTVQGLFEWAGEDLEGDFDFYRDLKTDGIFHPAFSLMHDDDSINFNFKIVKDLGFNSELDYISCEHV